MVVLVPCVVGAVAVTVMRVLLFVWDVNVPRECESDGSAGVVGGGVVAVSVGYGE